MPTWRSLSISLLLLCTPLLACTEPEPPPPGDGGVTEDAGSDAGSDGGDAGSDAGTGEDAVRVRRFQRYITPAGVEELPEDFTRNPVELFVLEGETLVSVPGRTGGPGEYVFPSVPRAPYFVKSGTDYVLTDARDVDLSVNTQGRSGAEELTVTSEVHLDISNARLWFGPTRPSEPLPELDVFSEEVSAFNQRIVSMGENQSRVVATLPDIYMPRFEQARGDRAWVIQLFPQTLGQRPDGSPQHYLSATRAVHLPPFSHDGTAPLRIAGVLEALEPSGVTVDWRATEFLAAAAQVHPSASVGSAQFRLLHAAPAPAEGWSSRNQLLRLSVSRSNAYDPHGTLFYGRLLPSQDTVVGRATVSTSAIFELPEQAPINWGTVSISVVDRISRLAAGPIHPGVWPPRSLSVDGTEAYSARTLGAGDPVVSWQPPSRGTPDAYVLTLMWFPGERGQRSSPFPRARFYVSGDTTSLRLPSGLMRPGNPYFFAVEAVRAEGYTVSDRPLALSDRIGVSRAQTRSGLLYLPETAP